MFLLNDTAQITKPLRMNDRVLLIYLTYENKPMKNVGDIVNNFRENWPNYFSFLSAAVSDSNHCYPTTNVPVLGSTAVTSDLGCRGEYTHVTSGYCTVLPPICPTPNPPGTLAHTRTPVEIPNHATY